jgi:hypothetical protein
MSLFDGKNKTDKEADIAERKLTYTPPLLIVINHEEDIAGGLISLQEADPNGGAMS